MTTEIGEKYIKFLSERDYVKMTELFDLNVTARFLVPAGLLTINTPENLISKINSWFCDSDHFELIKSDVVILGERIGVNYKFKCRENNEWFLVEQQTFSTILNGKIKFFALLCSGFQKIDM